MQGSTQADDSTELTINDDATDKAKIEARRVYDAVNCNVTAMQEGHNGKSEIAVFWDEDDLNVHGAESYFKANVIQSVMDSDASVTLRTVDEGDRSVRFVPN